ncbi:hypothetical protein [Clostridium botulinum]|uniref:hypothetical protein n=1 Tax=Clostridium botulinum TaxID=1491 RepID=UPI001FAF4C4B|nr:hypothetical protein [Clostridium botulinum]
MTKGALKEMILPGVIVIVTHIAVGLILRAEAAGPSIYVLIKLFSTITLVLTTIFVTYGLM